MVVILLTTYFQNDLPYQLVTYEQSKKHAHFDFRHEKIDKQACCSKVTNRN